MFMKIAPFVVAVILSAAVAAQESKPVPKDSMRVYIPGCAKGSIFTVGPRTADQPGSGGGPAEGTHLRMNGPKKVMAEIKRQEESMIEITGLIKKSQMTPGGISIGSVRITPGLSPSGSSSVPTPASNQVVIDVEGWRRVPGACPLR
jgi:hypothetical protein